MKPDLPPAHPTKRQYLSLAEAADYLGVSALTIRRRIADGTLTGYRFGPRALRVDLDELDAALRPVPTAGSGAA